jgi:hypothetical protein
VAGVERDTPQASVNAIPQRGVTLGLQYLSTEEAKNVSREAARDKRSFRQTAARGKCKRKNIVRACSIQIAVSNPVALSNVATSGVVQQPVRQEPGGCTRKLRFRGQQPETYHGHTVRPTTKRVQQPRQTVSIWPYRASGRGFTKLWRAKMRPDVESPVPGPGRVMEWSAGEGKKCDLKKKIKNASQATRRAPASGKRKGANRRACFP